MPESPQLKDFIPEQLTVNNQRRNIHHLFDEDDCYALWAAYSSGRPLLVRGKPGTGKSQMARAIAEHLGWAFVNEGIRGSTELSDLHWHFDAIGRLGEAQARGMQVIDSAPTKNSDTQDRLNPLNFLSPGAFWWAYNWKTAQQQYERCATRIRPAPDKPAPGNHKKSQWTDRCGGVVLLLDEIDKAEPDLPNGLLETLGHYQFTVPYVDHKDEALTNINPVQADPSRLLVVITTNEERELPSAFVRRCFVHTLKMEDSEEQLEGLEKRYHWLIERGKLHFGRHIDEAVYQHAAKLLWRDRSEHAHNRYPPGLAEYIDLLNALKALNKADQQQRLEKIARYALQKEVNE